MSNLSQIAINAAKKMSPVSISSNSDWDESKHPRVPAGNGDDSGQFTEKEDTTASTKPEDLENNKFAENFNNPNITKDNFHINTFTDYDKINIKQLPQREPDFISRSGSKYWYEGDLIYRQSDHWGRNIASCNWLIDGKASQSYTQGVSKLSEFYRRSDGKFVEGQRYLTIKTSLRRNGGGAMDVDKEIGVYVKSTYDYYVFDNFKIAKHTLAAANKINP